ncbi:odorant receptor 43a-like [Culicoides brevitarsis]|uniref:odorant receptor 43a-like n=1 Tax=Culicoides brevitarsis TaxID=469753 RepID=UPI00307BF064
MENASTSLVFTTATIRIISYFLHRSQLYDTKAVEVFLKIIEKHQKMLKFIKELSKLMAIYVFIDFIIYSGFLCALLFYISINSELSGSLFRSNWYVQSMKLRKMFLMFSQTNTPPLQIKAYGLVMTLEVFRNILRASYSYFTLLKQLNG